MLLSQTEINIKAMIYTPKQIKFIIFMTILAALSVFSIVQEIDKNLNFLLYLHFKPTLSLLATQWKSLDCNN